MPANSRSTKSSSNASKKASKKAKKRAPRKAAKKVAKKATKKVAKKTAKKVTKKVTKKAARKKARRPQGSRRKIVEVSAEERNEMIRKAAYLRAEKRNFQNGDPEADWLSCEKEVDALLSKAAH